MVNRKIVQSPPKFEMNYHWFYHTWSAGISQKSELKTIRLRTHLGHSLHIKWIINVYVSYTWRVIYFLFAYQNFFKKFFFRTIFQLSLKYFKTLNLKNCSLLLSILIQAQKNWTKVILTWGWWPFRRSPSGSGPSTVQVSLAWSGSNI